MGVKRVDERQKGALGFLLLEKEVKEVGGRIHDSGDFEVVDRSSLQGNSHNLPNRFVVHHMTQHVISIPKNLFRHWKDARERVPIDIRLGWVDEGSDHPQDIVEKRVSDG